MLASVCRQSHCEMQISFSISVVGGLLCATLVNWRYSTTASRCVPLCGAVDGGLLCATLVNWHYSTTASRCVPLCGAVVGGLLCATLVNWRYSTTASRCVPLCGAVVGGLLCATLVNWHYSTAASRCVPLCGAVVGGLLCATLVNWRYSTTAAVITSAVQFLHACRTGWSGKERADSTVHLSLLGLVISYIVHRCAEAVQHLEANTRTWLKYCLLGDIKTYWYVTYPQSKYRTGTNQLRKAHLAVNEDGDGGDGGAVCSCCM